MQSESNSRLSDALNEFSTIDGQIRIIPPFVSIHCVSTPLLTVLAELAHNPLGNTLSFPGSNKENRFYPSDLSFIVIGSNVYWVDTKSFRQAVTLVGFKCHSVWHSSVQLILFLIIQKVQNIDYKYTFTRILIY